MEALVALVILGLIAATFLVGLSTVFKADFIVTEQVSAESLATGQIESIKNHSYISYADAGHGEYDLIATSSGYTIEVVTTPVNPATGQALGTGQDNGVQKIAITVRHEGRQIITLESYKVNRQ